MKKRKDKNETMNDGPIDHDEMFADAEVQDTHAAGTAADNQTRTGEQKDLGQELEDARAKADEYLDGWQRARADFANYKRRVERDQAQTQQNAAASVIKRHIEILDDLERALRNRPAEGDGAAWADGIELIYRKFMVILESQGVKMMNVKGEMFDPNLHEAISQEDSREHESGQIIDVVQQGYLIGERVLRPALVRVAR